MVVVVVVVVAGNVVVVAGIIVVLAGSVVVVSEIVVVVLTGSVVVVVVVAGVIVVVVVVAAGSVVVVSGIVVVVVVSVGVTTMRATVAVNLCVGDRPSEMTQVKTRCVTGDSNGYGSGNDPVTPALAPIGPFADAPPCSVSVAAGGYVALSGAFSATGPQLTVTASPAFALAGADNGLTPDGANIASKVEIVISTKFCWQTSTSVAARNAGSRVKLMITVRRHRHGGLYSRSGTSSGKVGCAALPSTRSPVGAPCASSPSAVTLTPAALACHAVGLPMIFSATPGPAGQVG